MGKTSRRPLRGADRVTSGGGSRVTFSQVAGPGRDNYRPGFRRLLTTRPVFSVPVVQILTPYGLTCAFASFAGPKEFPYALLSNGETLLSHHLSNHPSNHIAAGGMGTLI